MSNRGLTIPLFAATYRLTGARVCRMLFGACRLALLFVKNLMISSPVLNETDPHQLHRNSINPEHLFNYVNAHGPSNPYGTVAHESNMDKKLFWILFACCVKRMVDVWQLGQNRAFEALACVLLANGGEPFPRVVDEMILMHPVSPPKIPIPILYIWIVRNKLGSDSIATPSGFHHRQMGWGDALVINCWLYTFKVFKYCFDCANNNFTRQVSLI